MNVGCYIHNYTGPPQPPPKIASKTHDEDKDDTDRDSGLWTGSATESVTDWTKHHNKAPSGIYILIHTIIIIVNIIT